jgi:ABC-type phosphate/phosphonate transport system substrate-binding protein
MVLRKRAAALVAVYVLASASLYGADKPITIGLIIDGSTAEEREPLRVYLTKAMGRPVNLVAPDTYGETVVRLANGSLDFACLGALMYVRAHAKQAFPRWCSVFLTCNFTRCSSPAQARPSIRSAT